MKTEEITDDLFLSTLKEVVKENPDYVYAEDEKFLDDFDEVSCVYFDEDGKPACVVGHVFDRLGVDPDVIMAQNGIQNGMPFGYNYLRKLFSGLSRDFVDRVSIVQRYQDEGSTWAEAYRLGME